MAAINVLEINPNGMADVVIHFTVPVGNNSAGVTWKLAALNSGWSGKTKMATGTGPGQISSADAALVASGDLIEIVVPIPAYDGSGAIITSGKLTTIATAAQNDWLARAQAALKYYGYTQ